LEKVEGDGSGGKRGAGEVFGLIYLTTPLVRNNRVVE
jgi:hypothetical protein